MSSGDIASRLALLSATACAVVTKRPEPSVASAAPPSRRKPRRPSARQSGHESAIMWHLQRWLKPRMGARRTTARQTPSTSPAAAADDEALRRRQEFASTQDRYGAQARSTGTAWIAGSS